MKLKEYIYDRIFKWRSRRLTEAEIHFSTVVLKSNNFLNNEIIFYFENRHNPIINKYLNLHYKSLNKQLNKKGLHLVYIPRALQDRDRIDFKELVAYLQYSHPELSTSDSAKSDTIIKSIFSGFGPSLFYKWMGAQLGIHNCLHAGFIHCRDFERNPVPERKWEYSLYNLSPDNPTKLHHQIDHYIKRVQLPGSNIQRSAGRRDLNNYHADEFFETDSNQISPEIKNAVEALKRISNEKILLSSVVYLIQILKDIHPEVCKTLSKELYSKIQATEVKLSRIHIDKHYRIFLPDFNNTEIKLTPLVKTFYLFMLKHPEGIKFKELSDHRTELMNIYMTVGNRSDMDQIENSINELTDIRSNSVNEKCSRIKEAFLSKFDDPIARNYYITGDRSDRKSIKIPPSLIDFSENM